MFSGYAPTFELMHQIVQNPFGLWFMLIGVVAATFHFSNGLWSFFIHWGITVGPRSQRVSAYFSGAMFLAFGTMGIRAIIAFHP
jgi:succinate dehydrogenase / fumarate reductase, cytochrome b subunit